jgi:hypothetical protein
MSAAKRAREARRRRPDPYATIHADLMLAMACSLPAVELAAWLLLNANHVPGPDGTGEAVLPYATATRGIRRGATEGGVGPASYRRAIVGLVRRGVVELKRPGVRPGAAGGAQPRGKAAVYTLPHRTSSPPRLAWPPQLQRAGVGRPEGKVRIRAERIRADVRGLSSPALRVLLVAISVGDRTAAGALRDPSPRSLSPTVLAGYTGLSRASVARGLAELVEAGRLSVACPGAGRRSARYGLAACYRSHERHAPAQPMVSSRSSVAKRKTAVRGSEPLPWRDASAKPLTTEAGGASSASPRKRRPGPREVGQRPAEQVP